MLKQMIGRRLPHMSHANLFVYADMLDPRVKLAAERLLYAQRLFHHGPDFVQLMAHAEGEYNDSSWLCGLRADLRWLHAVEVIPDPTLLTQDMSELIDQWQSDQGRWKRRVRNACYCHIYQESMMLEVKQWHGDIFALLRNHHFTFSPDPLTLRLQESVYPCPDCGRTFTTPQGVHTHRRKAHGIYSSEHHLLDSATCPACLTFLWSTQRVQQHLAYMPRDGRPNACFAYLQQIGYKVAYSAEHLPRALNGQSRRDALTAAGPFSHGPTLHARTLQALHLAHDAAEAAYNDYLRPEDPLHAGERLGDALTLVTRHWFRDFCEAQYDFDRVERPQDRWIDVLCKLPQDFESWVARVFLLWGQHILPDLIAELWDGDAEAYLDQEFADLATDFDEYWMEARLRRLQHLLQVAQRPPPPPVPHRAIRPPQNRNRPRTLVHHEVPRLLADQEEWHADLAQIRWQDMPPDPTMLIVYDLAPKPTYFIVHLFAGRRRDTDLHAWLQRWAQGRDFSLTILSLDTAIAPVLGNLDSGSDTWHKLRDLYLQGFVAATVSGHPCETFSSARWTPPPSDRPDLHWPRPLRTALRLFGLDHRKMRELRQTKLGSAFFLQTVWTLACHLVFGGVFIEEHPGTPRDPEHPSIWRSSLLQLFRRHPDVRFFEIAQWRFGAATAKPTGLLTLRMPHFLGDLYKHADDRAVRPTAHAIGVNSEGAFRTSCHKEYPSRLSAGLANAIASQLLRNHRARLSRVSPSLPSPLATWVHEVARSCTEIRSEATWLPDFQG